VTPHTVTAPSPTDPNSQNVAALTSTKSPPALWSGPVALSLNLIVYVALATKDTVWLRSESLLPPLPFFGLPSVQVWTPLGAPKTNTNSDAPVDSVVAVFNGTAPLPQATPNFLAALRDGGVSSLTYTGAAGNWTHVALPSGLDDKVLAIAAVRVDRANAGPATCAGYVALIDTGTPGTADLYYVDLMTSTSQKVLSAVTAAVVPYARYNGSMLDVVGVSDDFASLQAAQYTLTGAGMGTVSPQVSGSLPGVPLAQSGALDGRAAGAGADLTVYAVCDSSASSSALLVWRPFTSTPPPSPISLPGDSSVGAPKGAIALYGKFGYLPGSQPGQLIRVGLGGNPVGGFVSAVDCVLALSATQPASTPVSGDLVAILDSGGTYQPANVVTDPIAGLAGFPGTSVVWLDTILIPNAAPAPLAFATSGAGTVGHLDTTGKLVNLNASATGVTEIVIKGTGGTASIEFHECTFQSAHVVKLASTSGFTPNSNVDYWLPSSPNLKVVAAVNLNSTNNGWDSSLLPYALITFPAALAPPQMRVAAAMLDSTAPFAAQRLAFDGVWSALPTGSTPFTLEALLSGWSSLIQDNSSNPTLAWEYWTGSGWWTLPLSAENTGNLKYSGQVSFTVPADIAATDVAGKTSHWVRARLVGGDYGKETVTVTSTTVGSTTTQTVDRNTTGIQPPHVLTMWVDYAFTTPQAPTYLVTFDSGSYRNQSAANAQSGAQVDLFTPLAATLAALGQSPSAAAGTGAAGASGCGCGTSGATAAATATAQASPTDTSGPALFLGLTQGLAGVPVNLLFLVDREGDYGSIAPLEADAIVADRFAPIVAEDRTRGLGESGILSLDFPVAPASRELFGKDLTWLRVGPAKSGTTWAPSLRGVFLNAVWADSGETLTREPVGSSDGRPGLTAQLARPPVLQGSLELRVKEPLSDDERAALLSIDPQFVQSTVQDLPGDWVLWTQVRDPLDYDSASRVYSLDEDAGVITFGNGLNGMIPPIGRDVIVAFSYRRTDPGAPGSDDVPGNDVSARASLNLISPLAGVESVTAADHSAGGARPEDVDRVLRFSTARLRHRGRAVTARDFEDLALELSPNLVQARCDVRGSSLKLIAVKGGTDPLPTAAERRELLRALLECASEELAAANALTVAPPRIRELRVVLNLVVADLSDAGEVSVAVGKRLSGFFDAGKGGADHSGWPLGQSPEHDDIAFALLDVPKLEEVAAIELLEVLDHDAEAAWPSAVANDEIVRLAADPVRIVFTVSSALA
jgi:hypothetical protein